MWRLIYCSNDCLCFKHLSFSVLSISSRWVNRIWGIRKQQWEKATWQLKGGLFDLHGPNHDQSWGTLWINDMHYFTWICFDFFHIFVNFVICLLSPFIVPCPHKWELLKYGKFASISPTSLCLCCKKCHCCCVNAPLLCWLIFSGWLQQQDLIEFLTVRLILKQTHSASYTDAQECICTSTHEWTYLQTEATQKYMYEKRKKKKKNQMQTNKIITNETWLLFKNTV